MKEVSTAGSRFPKEILAGGNRFLEWVSWRDSRFQEGEPQQAGFKKRYLQWVLGMFATENPGKIRTCFQRIKNNSLKEPEDCSERKRKKWTSGAIWNLGIVSQEVLGAGFAFSCVELKSILLKQRGMVLREVTCISCWSAVKWFQCGSGKVIYAPFSWSAKLCPENQPGNHQQSTGDYLPSTRHFYGGWKRSGERSGTSSVKLKCSGPQLPDVGERTGPNDHPIKWRKARGTWRD